MKLGMIHHLAVIGEPPEHRSYRWEYLRGEKTFHAPDISPTAIVEAFATVDGGIETPTRIGPDVMLMKHSHVGHDSQIGFGTNVAPGAIIGGFCSIGRNCKIGLGASIRPRTTIGNGAIIGAGAVVVCDVPDGEVWAGNPARPLDRKSDPELDIWQEWYESWNHFGRAE